MTIIIVFEGADGSGKTTQKKMLRTALEGLGLTVENYHEPFGAPIFKEYRGLKTLFKQKKLLTKSEILLYAMSRLEFVHHIKEAERLFKPNVIIIDRFVQSTIVYQCLTQGDNADIVKRLDEILESSLQVSLTLVLDVNYNCSMERCAKRKVPDLEYYETDDKIFFEKLRAGYLTLCDGETVVSIDATRSKYEVHDEIIECVLLLDVLPSTFAEEGIVWGDPARRR